MYDVINDFKLGSPSRGVGGGGGRVVVRKWGTVPKKLRREGKGVTNSHPKVKLLDGAKTSKQL